MGHCTSSDRCENVPRKEEKRPNPGLQPSKNGGPRLGLCLPRNSPLFPLSLSIYTLSSQDTSSLSSSPSSLPLSFPLQPGCLSRFLSLSHLSVNLRKITCTVYIIYIWFLWFSVTLTSWCATYLPTYLPTHLPTHPSKSTLFIVQSIGRAASSHYLGKDGWREFPSLPSPAPRRLERIISADRTVQSLPSTLYSYHSSAEWLSVFLQ